MGSHLDKRSRFVLPVANLFECIASGCKLQFVADGKTDGSDVAKLTSVSLGGLRRARKIHLNRRS